MAELSFPHIRVSSRISVIVRGIRIMLSVKMIRIMVTLKGIMLSVRGIRVSSLKVIRVSGRLSLMKQMGLYTCQVSWDNLSGP